MTRRQFLAGVSALLVSCGRAPRPTEVLPAPQTTADDAVRHRTARFVPSSPRTLPAHPVIDITVPPLPPTLRHQAQRWLHQLSRSIPPHWRLQLNDDNGTFRLRTIQDSPTGLPIGSRWFVPVTSHDNLVHDLPAAALPAILDGTIDNWQALGSAESLPIERVSVRDEGFLFSKPHAVVARVPELLTLAQPGVLAFVEPTAIHPRLSVLTLDSLDPLRQAHGAAIPEVLTEWLVVEGPVQLLPDEARIPIPIDRPHFLTVTVVGDIILGRTVHRIMERRDDWQAPFRDVADELAWSDLTIGNLECALSDRFPPPDDPYTMRFLTFPRAVAGLTLAGIDAVSLANNHSMDFGRDGLHDTKATLDRAGISWFGAGDDLRQACEPALLRVGNVTIALLGFDGISAQWYGATDTTAGTAPLEPEIVATAIRRAATRAAIVVPYFHWGVEYTLIPTESQRQIAHLAIDSGASLVVGSHPHWVQGIEWYRGKPIFYSLGNFVFDQEWSSETKQGLILQLWFSGTELRRYRLVPVIIEHYHRPRLAHGEEASSIMRRVRESSRALS